jgi:hypothetical protein
MGYHTRHVSVFHEPHVGFRHYNSCSQYLLVFFSKVDQLKNKGFATVVVTESLQHHGVCLY